MPHKCGWIIDRDELNSWDSEPLGDRNSDVGVMGPRDGVDDESLMTVPFRLYDDDGELYYSGRMTPECMDHFGECDPLYAFGQPNAGATELRYPDESGEWVTL